MAALVGASEQPVLASERNVVQRALGGVVVELEVSIADVAGERRRARSGLRPRGRSAGTAWARSGPTSIGAGRATVRPWPGVRVVARRVVGRVGRPRPRRAPRYGRAPREQWPSRSRHGRRRTCAGREPSTRPRRCARRRAGRTRYSHRRGDRPGTGPGAGPGARPCGRARSGTARLAARPRRGRARRARMSRACPSWCDRHRGRAPGQACRRRAAWSRP